MLDHCFDCPVPDLSIKEAEDLNQNHDIDELYDLVKMHHATNRDERAERVQLNPQVILASDSLYDNSPLIGQSHTNACFSLALQHPSLIPRLRPYQEHAVKWMLEQERYRENLDTELREDTEELNPLFRQV